jgi:hypothetical protein
VVDILSHCENLTSLTLAAFTVFRGVSDPPVVTMSSVRRLKVLDHADLLLLFTHVKFPNLLSLAVEDSFLQGAGAFTDGLKALLAISDPPLMELRLHQIKGSEATILWVLERLKDLSRLQLSIYDEKIGEKTIEAFTRTGTGRKGWLCPNLKHLSINNCGWSVNMEEAIGSLVRVRMDLEKMKILTTTRLRKKDGRRVRARGAVPPIPTVMEEIRINEVSYQLDE